MKDEYLKKLEEELENNGFINTDEVIEKYRKRYDFGLESGMSEEEIEERLGDPSIIVSKMVNESDNKYDNSDSKFKIEINTIADDVKFEESIDDETHLYMDDIEEDLYDIVNNNREIAISAHTKKFFGLNRRRPGLFTIALPKDMKLGKVKLCSNSGDFVSKIDLNAKSFDFKFISGDVDFKKITAKNVIFHVVSGDLQIDEINAEDISLSSVSGDMDIEYLLSNNLKIDTVSGDINIKEASYAMNIKSQSISGDVVIGGKKYKNVKSKVKEVFKSES